MSVSVLTRPAYVDLPRAPYAYYPTPSSATGSGGFKRKQADTPSCEVIDLVTPEPAPFSSVVLYPTPSSYGVSGTCGISAHSGEYHAQAQSVKRRRVEEVAKPQTAPPSCDDAEGHYTCVPQSVLGQQDRYTILNVIGQGTFGKVVRAWDRVQHAHCAIKIIRSIPKYRDASKVELRVLNALKRTDPCNMRRCIQLRDSFEHKNHVCMVFDLLACSVYDFIKDNAFHPFPVWQIKDFAVQILNAIQYMHQQRLVHTDLKPENLMLLSSDWSLRASTKYPSRTCKELRKTDIMLIDFGSATFESEFHSSVVSTRHYRAPEIILTMGWTYPCDIWSIGCILVEMYAGDALFQTHDNLEHLAMMEAILGPFPSRMVQQLGSAPRKFFTKGGKVDFPNAQVTKSSRKFVRGLKPLSCMTRPEDALFLDLVQRMLVYEPSKRITAQDALRHPFFTQR